MNHIETMKQTLDALEWAESLADTSDRSCQEAKFSIEKALKGLRAAIAQQTLSVGDSRFEEWYQSYERQGISKQVARDAYAAGMGDPLVAVAQPDKGLFVEMTQQTWTKKPAIECRNLQLDSIIAVGFGSAFCTKDGHYVYDEQDVVDEKYSTFGDMEKLALADPDHDWQIAYYAPLYEAVYQRNGLGQWVLIEKGQGFA